MSVSIAHGELNGSPVEALDDEGVFTARRRLICPWDNRQTLADELLGRRGNDGTLILPQAYPHRPDSGARAAAVESIEPFSEDVTQDGVCEDDMRIDALASYTLAVLSVRYEPMTFDEDAGGGGQLIQERMSGGHELLTLPAALAWTTNFGAPATACKLVEDQEVPARIVPYLAWSVTLLRLTKPLNGNFRSFLGHVNTNQLASKRYGLTFPADTVVYLDFDSEAVSGSSDSSLINLTVNMLIRENKRVSDGAILGWNGYWRSEANDFDTLKSVTAPTSAGNFHECHDIVEYPDAALEGLGLPTTT